MLAKNTLFFLFFYSYHVDLFFMESSLEFNHDLRSLYFHLFSRLLQIKPEAGRKVLSENSLLKNIPFDELFLGEEQVQEGKVTICWYGD